MVLASLIAAFAPLILYVATVSIARRHDRQIIASMLIAAFWGGAAATSLSLAADTFVQAELMSPSALRSPFDVVLVAPMVEETVKAMVFLAFLLVARLETPLEGALLGAAIGLGFAATENFAAFTRTWEAYGVERWFIGVGLRTMMPTVMHATATAAAGAIAGAFAKGPQFDRWVAGPFVGYAVGAGIHMGFNGGQHAASVIGSGALAGFVAVVVLMVAVGVGRWAGTKESQALRAELRRIGTERGADFLASLQTHRVDSMRLALLSLREQRRASPAGSLQRAELARLAQRLERSPT